MKISVIGLGHFGYAMFHHLDQKQAYDLWGNDKDQPDVDFLNTNFRPPRYFQNYPISRHPHFTTNYTELLDHCDVLIIAVVSSALPIIAKQLQPVFHELQNHQQPLPVLVSLTKALSETALTSTQILADHLADFPQLQIAALAGGTTAQDLIDGQPLGVSLAVPELSLAQPLKNIFESPTLQVQITLDLQGLQLASSLKNVVSIFAGLIAGQGYQYGVVTHTISLVAAEIERLALDELGAHPQTFSIGSQCWGNDMFMSATGQTRNRAFGEYLGSHPGLKYQTALRYFTEELHQSVEGANTIKVLDYLFSSQHQPQLDLQKYPLLNYILHLAHHRARPADLLHILSQV